MRHLLARPAMPAIRARQLPVMYAGTGSSPAAAVLHRPCSRKRAVARGTRLPKRRHARAARPRQLDCITQMFGAAPAAVALLRCRPCRLQEATKAIPTAPGRRPGVRHGVGTVHAGQYIPAARSSRDGLSTPGGPGRCTKGARGGRCGTAPPPDARYCCVRGIPSLRARPAARTDVAGDSSEVSVRSRQARRMNECDRAHACNHASGFRRATGLSNRGSPRHGIPPGAAPPAPPWNCTGRGECAPRHHV